MKEKRKHIRHPSKTPVEFVVRGRVYRGDVTNVSFGGVFIDAKGKFSHGDVIFIHFPSQKSITGIEKRSGTIVRVAENGIGVQFQKPGYIS